MNVLPREKSFLLCEKFNRPLIDFVCQALLFFTNSFGQIPSCPCWCWSVPWFLSVSSCNRKKTEQSKMLENPLSSCWMHFFGWLIHLIHIFNFSSCSGPNLQQQLLNQPILFAAWVWHLLCPHLSSHLWTSSRGTSFKCVVVNRSQERKKKKTICLQFS